MAEIRPENFSTVDCMPVITGTLVTIGVRLKSRLKRSFEQAPRWMREHGLEWLFRLVQEPQRLWRRYLICGSSFVIRISLELLGLKRNN